jgi:hypothetical protein
MSIPSCLPLDIWRNIAIQNQGHNFYREDHAPLFALVLIDRHLNSLLTPILYETVNLEALPTLLARSDLVRCVKNAALVCGFSRSPDFYRKPDTTGCPPSVGSDLHVPQSAIVRHGIDLRTVSALVEGRRPIMAALLMSICPHLDRVFMIWSPADEASIPCAPPISTFLHPDVPSSVSVRSITRVDLCSPSNDVRGNSENFTAITLLRLMSLPAIHTITVEFVSGTDAWPSDIVSHIPQLYGTSALQHLALHHCKMRSGQVLKDILSIPRGLRSLIFRHRPFMIGDLDNLDLGALSAALSGSPCLRTLTYLEVFSQDPTPLSFHAFGILKVDDFQALVELKTSCRYLLQTDRDRSHSTDLIKTLPQSLRLLELTQFGQVYPDSARGHYQLTLVHAQLPDLRTVVDLPPSGSMFEDMSLRTGLARFTTFSALPFTD